jgi:hypothetical protein
MNRLKWKSVTRLMVLTPLIALLGGCASYEYDLVRPEAHAGHIGTKESQRITMDNVEYVMKSSNDHLVIDAYNRGEEPMKLIGDDSTAIDPKGESHPLRSRTIPPGSFVRLILPPPPPQIQRSGPTFGFGVGVVGSRFHHRDFGYGGINDFYEPGPTYYAVYDSSDATLWRWEGDRTDARLILVFDRGKEPIRHDFLFRRVKQ